jgi:hypothetical protein
VFLTRPPRKSPERNPVRLACIRHAASVDPEPGSNSPPRILVSTHAPHPEGCVASGQISNFFWLRYAARTVRQIVNPISGFPEKELTKRPNNMRRRVLMLRLRRPPPATHTRVPQAGPSACQRAFAFARLGAADALVQRARESYPLGDFVSRFIRGFREGPLRAGLRGTFTTRPGDYSPSPVPSNVVFRDGANELSNT